MDNVSIKLKVGGVEIPSHPVFGDDVKLKFSKQENQVFLRSKIDGQIKFVGSDFDFIASCSHDTEFTIEVYRGTSLFGSGTFIKSDCTLNYDDKVCSVKLTVTDRYEKFLANYDNKYNLVKLAPSTQALKLKKRAILQFFMRSDNKIGIYVGNMSFEMDTINDAMSKTDTQLVNHHKFTRIYTYATLTVNFDSSLLENQYNNLSDFSGIGGVYSATYSGDYATRYDRDDGLFSIRRVYDSLKQTYVYKFYNSNGYEVHPRMGDEEYTVICNIDALGMQIYTENSGEGGWYLVDICGNTTQQTRTVYCRMLSDQNTYGDNPTLLSSITDDIVENTGNYLYVAGVSFLSVGDRVRMTTEMSNNPTPYPNGNRQYYVPPTVSAGHVAYPISPSTWGSMAFWLDGSQALYNSLDNCNVQYSLNDAYPIHSAISKLLTEVDSSVMFSNSSTYSEFLYQTERRGQAMIATPKLRSSSNLYITPITNVKKTRYEQAAQRGDITLKQVLDMLRDMYQCYWYIDDYNRLRIEHISYFKHGRDYILGASAVDVDLTTMKDMPNGLPWAFGTNEAEFDRGKCPSRYEFQWGDECTEQFNGYAIDIADAHADAQKKEKVNVTNFTADIDYTVINPSGVSDDIYAVMEANSYYQVPIAQVRLSSDSPIYAMQNGYLSFLYTEQNYWLYDLGGWKATANGVSLNVVDVRRFAKQSVGIPLSNSNVAPRDILTIRTGLGIASMDSMEVNADTLYAKAKAYLEADNNYDKCIELEKEPYPHSSSAWFLYNNSNFQLVVRWMNSSGTITETRIEPESYAVTTTGQNPPKPTILSIRLDETKLTMVSEPVRAYGGFCSPSIERSEGAIDCMFFGRTFPNRDWCYVCIQTGDKAANIVLVANSEANHDRGYVARVPIPYSYDINSKALIYASGIEEKTYRIAAHTRFFVGYTKDNSQIGGNDKMRILISEVV